MFGAGDRLQDDSLVSLQTLDFQGFLEHFDHTLVEEALQQGLIGGAVADPVEEVAFDVALDFFDHLKPDLHDRELEFVALATLANFGLNLNVFDSLSEGFLLLFLGLVHDLSDFELLFVGAFLFDLA